VRRDVLSANLSFKPEAILIMPLFTYIISYLYLAFYHENLCLFNVIVHEGGTLTLLQSMFYFSHFLGHVPVYIIIALVFTGFYLNYSGPAVNSSPKKSALYFVVLIVFLLLCLLGSFLFFGKEDTMAFILLKKQSVTRYEAGGSWNLHLPSLITVMFIIPLYIIFFRLLFRRQIQGNKQGIFMIIAGLSMILFITAGVNMNDFSAVVTSLTSPRYLAHSIRELATFPLTYFPPALYLLFKAENEKKRSTEVGKIPALPMVLAALFLLLAALQAYFPLAEGIGSLAQKPGFAKGGKLSVSYLLASHYFEHFTDALFFSFLCFVLYSLPAGGRKHE